ncbi:hypothetical protein L1887_51459 [Cichorium endivia]|nr:hypothetical protein L1887_51459 [Cichorium endivia]
MVVAATQTETPISKHKSFAEVTENTIWSTSAGRKEGRRCKASLVGSGDDVGSALGDHVADSLRVSGQQTREGARIDDAQTVDAEDAEVGVQHTGLLVLGHAAGRRGVPYRHEVLPDARQDLVIGGHVQAGERLGAASTCALHGVGVEHLARALECGDRHLLIDRAREPVGPDRRKVLCVGALERNGSLRHRRDNGHQQRGELLEREAIDNVVGDEVAKVADEAGSAEVLDLRPVARQALERASTDGVEVGAVPLFECNKVGNIVGEDALVVQVKVGDGGGEEDGVVCLLGWRVDVDRVGGAEEDVVLHMLANVAVLDDNRDVLGSKLISGTNARDHKELRRLERSCADDDLLSCLERPLDSKWKRVINSDRLGPGTGRVEGDFLCERLEDDVEIGTLVVLRLLVERARSGTLAVALLDRKRGILRAQNVARAHVICSRDPDFIEAVEQRAREGLCVVREPDADRAAAREGGRVVLRWRIVLAKFAARTKGGEGLLIVRQRVVEGPLAVSSKVDPGLLGALRWTVVEHKVSCRATADALSSRVAHLAVVVARLAFSDETPVDQTVGKVRGAGAHAEDVEARSVDQLLVDRRAAVVNAGLQHGNSNSLVLGETRGERHARRAASDDDVIVRVSGRRGGKQSTLEGIILHRMGLYAS